MAISENARCIINNADLQVYADPATGGVTQLVLFGREMLAAADPAEAELAINDQPFRLRSHAAEVQRECMKAAPGIEIPLERLQGNPDLDNTMHGERFINQFTAFGLDVTRNLRADIHLQQLTLCYQLHRGKAQATYPIHGPGSWPVEGRMYVDTFTVPRWQWQFWGDDTRMIHLSLHSNGPDGPYGHVGYDRGPVAEVKGAMCNYWRRQYPGVMAIHGAVYYDEQSENWVAITCRLPQVGYYLDLDHAGLGLSYSFTLHDEFPPNQSLTLPEIIFHYGRTAAEMEQFIRDYTTQRWPEVPEWNSHTTWCNYGLWTPFTSWKQFWACGTKLIDNGACTGLGPYLMIHNWSRAMGGTSPWGYEPDPTMGPREDFEQGALALKARGVPLGMWMSHSGLAPGRDIDEDWFVYGVDNHWSTSWGTERAPALVTINPGHPGYIAYTKKWLKYYIELGFRWFFFDCGGWAMPIDFRPRDFMRFPGDTPLMAVRFYEEITPYAQSLDPGVIISGEGFSSDFPVHVTSIHANPVHATDGLGPRDFLLSLNRLPGKPIIIDQAGSLVPASGVCTLPGMRENPTGSIEAMFAAAAANPMNQAVTRFVCEHGCYHGEHLRGDFSIIDGHFFAPSKYKRQPITLPEAYASCTALVHAITGERFARAADGTFQVPEPGIYRMQEG